jgi:hypothetical protein
MKKLPSESETVISAQQISLEAARIVVLPRRGRIERICFRREERVDRKEGENVRRLRRTSSPLSCASLELSSHKGRKRSSPRAVRAVALPREAGRS